MGGKAFSYRTTKDRVVRIFWEGRCVRALGGNRGEALSAALAATDDKQRQALLQRATGNFRRGNERCGRR